MFSQPKNRTLAAMLALSGVLIPVSGLHKFYLGQPLWGLLYLLLSWTPIPKVASAIEAVWYLAQDGEQFDRNFNLGDAPQEAQLHAPAQSVESIATALRQLDSLRAEGLVSEYEFEQKRRQLLDRI
ncbi:MAG: NINE protein [Coleofasciculaceae cyanobacterium SM2_1_6]|nr:NINE protein [Coleofasciculaceae cyanobacterium SM2_1_6]